jgi:hypothetical protein
MDTFEVFACTMVVLSALGIISNLIWFNGQGAMWAFNCLLWSGMALFEHRKSK